MRDALVSEGRDENGLPNGELLLLGNVPSNWFSEGQQIKLVKFPTAYGTISLDVRSKIATNRKVAVDYHFERHEHFKCRKFEIRVAPTGHVPRDVEVFGDDEWGTLELNFGEQKQ